MSKRCRLRVTPPTEQTLPAAALVIAASGALAALETIDRPRHPAAVDHAWLVFVAGVVGSAGNAIVASYRVRAGRRLGSAALIADGLHARVDAVASLRSWPERATPPDFTSPTRRWACSYDAVAETGRRALDGVAPAVVGKIEDAIYAVPAIERVDRVRVRWVGHSCRPRQ